MERNNMENILVPIIFKVNKDKYFEFLEDLQEFRQLHNDSRAKLGRLYNHKTYPLNHSRITDKKIRINTILKYLQNKDTLEIRKDVLFNKRGYHKITYRTFSKTIAEMVLTGLITTCKKRSKETGNVQSYIKLKEKGDHNAK